MMKADLLASNISGGEMSFQIRCSAIGEGEPIPKRYTGDGENISPALFWTDVPEETHCFVLIVDDPDAPNRTFTHWILFNIPANCRSLDEGVPAASTLVDDSREGTNDFGDIGYGGPAPPPGKPHRYYFKLHALDERLELDPGASRQDVFEAMQGHILEEAQLMGTYGR
jgi:Raf kinase inhibitor-like YbhB/YbcL family protein